MRRYKYHWQFTWVSWIALESWHHPRILFSITEIWSFAPITNLACLHEIILEQNENCRQPLRWVNISQWRVHTVNLHSSMIHDSSSIIKRRRRRLLLEKTNNHRSVIEEIFYNLDNHPLFSTSFSDRTIFTWHPALFWMNFRLTGTNREGDRRKTVYHLL